MSEASSAHPDLRNVTIERVKATTLALPAIGTFHLAGGTFSEEGSPTLRVLVEIRASNGIRGFGEVTPCPNWCYETVESITSTIRHHLGPAIVGRPLWDIDGLHRIMDRVIHPGVSTGQPLAKSGIDVAVHDAIARTLNVPLYVLLGGKRVDKIQLSFLVSALSPDEAAELTRVGKKLGYTAFKVKIGLRDEQEDIAIVHAVRDTAGEEAFIWVDANQGYTLDVAMRQARRLADLGVAAFEQPLRGHSPSQFRRLVQLGAVPIAIDESIVSLTDLLEYIRHDAIDIAVAKVQRSAGLWYARQQCALAEAAGIHLFGSGLCETDLGMAVSAHLFAAFGITTPCDLNGRQFVGSAYLKKRTHVEDGVLTVPDGPGTGVEVDDELVEKHNAHI